MRSWKELTLEKIADLELAKVAAHEASKGKRQRQSVQKYQNSDRLQKLVNEIREGAYQPLPVIRYTCWDKSARKYREISCPAFRDQVVHWMLVLSMQPRFDQIFIQHAVANVPGKGVEYGRKLLKHWARDKRGAKYVLQLDIKKYYPSIPIPRLLEKFAHYIRDQRVLSLIEAVFRVQESDTGLTLGSYFNQWAAIFYLAELDHKIKEELRCKYYLRYVDDMLLLFPSRRKAERSLEWIRNELAELGLEIKERGRGRAKIFLWSKGFIDMLGYKTYRNGKQTLRRKNFLSIRRTCNRIERNGASKRQARSLLAKRGMAVHSDCKRLLDRVDCLIETLRIKEVAYENRN